MPGGRPKRVGEVILICKNCRFKCKKTEDKLIEGYGCPKQKPSKKYKNSPGYKSREKRAMGNIWPVSLKGKDSWGT